MSGATSTDWPQAQIVYTKQWLSQQVNSQRCEPSVVFLHMLMTVKLLHNP